MPDTTRFVPYGQNIPGDRITFDHATAVLVQLEQSLVAEGLSWRDVSLLLVANSKHSPNPKAQSASDQNFVGAIDAFTSAREWRPGLIGSTVLASFFRIGGRSDADIVDGLLLVAVVSAVLDEIPVAVEISLDHERKFAARNVLRAGLALHADAMEQSYGARPSRLQTAQNARGVLFATGSGHIDAQEFVDFKECYSVGQELVAEAYDEDNHAGDISLLGGCASNRAEGLMQCIYYSEKQDARVVYRFTYEHAAAIALLPYSQGGAFLAHPYERDPEVSKLEIEFHPHDQYSEGRYFYVRRINGESPIDFLVRHWDVDRVDFQEMLRLRTAIPAKPEAHKVTLASSLSKRDSNNRVWPNVPIWLDELDGEVLLRLVRAEDDDSNYYLMRLDPPAFVANARALAEYSKDDAFEHDATILCFLCESRKYVIEHERSEGRGGDCDEAGELLSAARREATVIGIYLNGEFSTGHRRSIGYHNYSQIAGVLNRSADVPFEVLVGRTSDVQVFISHASYDKPMVKAIVAPISGEIRRLLHWIDEDHLIVGEDLAQALRGAVASNANHYFLLFISARTLRSPWVKQELEWAIEREQRSGREFILPVFLESEVWDSLESAWGNDIATYLRAKRILTVHEHTDAGLAAASGELTTALQEWIRRHAGSTGTTPIATNTLSTLGQRPDAS